MTYFEISYTIENAESEDYALLYDFLEYIKIINRIKRFDHHQTLVRIETEDSVSLENLKKQLKTLFPNFPKTVYFHICKSLANEYTDFNC